MLNYNLTKEDLNKIVEKEECPFCGRDLDTGWECTGCDFDAYLLFVDTNTKMN